MAVIQQCVVSMPSRNNFRSNVCQFKTMVRGSNDGHYCEKFYISAFYFLFAGDASLVDKVTGHLKLY